MNEALWIPIVSMIAFALMVIAWIYFRHKSRLETQRTFRLALEKGSELSPEFIKQLGEPEPPKDRDLRRGLIWTAIGIATAMFAVILGEDDAVGPLLGIASFPGLIGIAYLVMWRFGPQKD